jgi:hypothetical protein
MKPFILFLALGVSAFGELNWERTEAKASVSAGATHAEAAFRFTNAGRNRIAIKRVDSTCDCVVAQASKNEYAPGDSGEVVVTFIAAGHAGLQRKSVVVVTDDPSAPSTTLTLTVDIEPPVEITPAVLLWRVGGEKKTQSIHVVIARDKPLTITAAECSAGDWKATLRPVKPGEEYYVDITPADTGTPGSGLVTIKAESPKDKPQTFTARWRVQ